jgi:hypothetical protein
MKHEEKANMVEIWKNICGYEGLYQVSNLGRVKSLSRHVQSNGSTRLIREQILSNNSCCNGYPHITLVGKGNRKTTRISHLVASTFIGPRPIGAQVCHNDGDRKNNTLTNLRYDTCSNNHADKHLHGTNQEGETNHNAKFRNLDILKIRTLLGKGEKQQAIASIYGVSTVTIHKIKHGKTWKHIP